MVGLQSRLCYYCSIRRNSLFSQFLENFRSHTNTCNTLMHVIPVISWKKCTLQSNVKGVNSSRENLSFITDDRQSYEGCECKVRIAIAKISKTSNL